MKILDLIFILILLSITQLNSQTKIEDKKKSLNTFTNFFGMEFVQIPAGEFMMGCSNDDSDCKEDEKPPHKVKISKDFYLGKYEVTQRQWKLIMGNNPSTFKSCGGYCPVDSVSWYDVQDFIKKLNSKTNEKYRLPTEAEWEYAARAGTKTKYYWGNEIDHTFFWYLGNSNDITHPVGEMKPNQFGLYDMIGNVWEWCEDWYKNDYYNDSPIIDPKGYKKGENHIFKGGSSHSNIKKSRISYRANRDQPGILTSGLGFRLVMISK